MEPSSWRWPSRRWQWSSGMPSRPQTMSRALMVTAAAAVVIILGVAIAFTRSNNPVIPNASISPQMGELGDSVVVFLIPDVGEPATMTAIDPTSGSVLWTHPTGVDPAAAVALDR